MKYKKKDRIKKLTAVLLLLFMTVTTFLGNCKPVWADSENGIVTVTVERFSIGKGYVVEPSMISIKEGENYASLLKRFLNSQGYEYDIPDTQYGAYLASIHNADPQDMKLNIPNSILKMARENGDFTLNNNLTNAYAPKLSEFSYTGASGWVYSINNVFPNVGIGNMYPKNGDVCRLQFTIYGTGADVSGKDVSNGKVYYTPADRSKLLCKVAAINQAKDLWSTIDGCEAAYDKAMKVLNNFDATQAEVDTALSALPSMEAVYPKSVALSDSNLSIDIDEKGKQLKASLYPKNTTFSKLVWKSSDERVVEVDEEGKLLPVSVGEADITVSTINGCSATCHVVVKDRPLTKIVLNRSSLSCERDDTFQLSVVEWIPENTTDEKNVTWTTSDEKVATVSEDGYVVAKKLGEVDIKATTKTGIDAICHVTVGNGKELAEAIEKKIFELPNSADMKIKDIKGVYALRDEFESLKEESKAYISEDTISKLKACIEKADVLTVISKINNLPSISVLKLEDESKVQEARVYYDALSSKNQKLVGRPYINRLSKAENRLKDLKEEAKNVEDKMIKLPDEVTLADIDLVISVRNAYEGELTQAQKSIISEEAKNKLANALGSLQSLITSAIVAVDTSKEVDINSKEIQEFLKAIAFYEDMEGIMEVPEDTKSKIDTTKKWIEQAIHTCEGITVESPWYIRTKVSDVNGKTEFLKQIKKAYDSSKASIVFAKEISYEDIRNKSNYSQEKTVAITFKLPTEYDSMKNPKILMVKDGKIKELDATYNSESNSMTVHSRSIGKLILADVPVAIKDISISSTAQVEKGGTISLKAHKLPESATEPLEIRWKSSNADIATVDDNGIVTGISEGTVTITASLASNSDIKAQCKVTVVTKANSLSKSVEDILSETRGYILSIDKNPAKGSEWFVIGLARGRMDINSGYFNTYYNHMVNYLNEKYGKLTDTVKYTEYSKAIVAMTAIGKDARNIGGYNLLANLADFNEIKKQGINGPIWALIALKTNPDYVIPEVSGVSKQTTEEVLIDYILSNQKSDGGWNLSGKSGDVDLTGMALQALAPYYNKEGREKVTVAINKALSFLSKNQLENGGFATSGVETSESNAQVITALCALGIDPETDPRFIKNGYWSVENILKYHISGSGFMHVKAEAGNNGGAEAGIVDGMATEQAHYALVAYNRLKNEKTSLYDMSDLSIKAGGSGDDSGTGINNENSKPEVEVNKVENNISSILSEAIEGKSVPKVSKTTDTAKKKDKKSVDKKTTKDSKEDEEGWNFTGEEYEGSEDSLDTGLEGKVNETEGTRVSSNKILKEYLPYSLCILCGAAVVGVCIYFRKKK
jgi:uncharacterized protein YjdB